jgi:carbon storage regulator
MLVLSRKVGEQIVIDGRIRVVVTAVQGDKVRVGIEAPQSVRIDRQEVHERIARVTGERWLANALSTGGREQAIRP